MRVPSKVGFNVEVEKCLSALIGNKTEQLDGTEGVLATRLAQVSFTLEVSLKTVVGLSTVAKQVCWPGSSQPASTFQVRISVVVSVKWPCFGSFSQVDIVDVVVLQLLERV